MWPLHRSAAALALCAGLAQTPAPAPLAPLPSARQLAWSELEFYAFVHFNMNTFTDREWGEGSEDPALFAPSALDCAQWVRVAKSAGMRGIILTAKHHDGFCLWPSKLTEHDVEASPWRGGKGDVLRELSDACRAQGLKFGVYLSPWDRNQPSYGDSQRYNDYFVGQLEEVLTNYGEIFEVWFDGACGEGPNGKRQVYDWPRFRETVRRLQPNAVMFSDVGPDVRWIGNESGSAGETCWSMLSPEGFEPGAKAPAMAVLNSGLEHGTAWIPGECDVSIRPGWYYHASQDGEVKSLEHLLELWYSSVGRNASLLLNLPVDRRGLVHENDAARLLEFRAAREAIFARNVARGARASATHVRGRDPRFAASNAVDGDPRTYWATDDGVLTATLHVALDTPGLIDHVVLGEALELGQRVKRFRVVVRDSDVDVPVAAGTTIGRKRIVRFPPVRCDDVLVFIDDARAAPALATVEAYCAPPTVEIRAPDTVFLEKTSVELVANQPGAEIRYTLDATLPTSASTLYTGRFELTHSTVVTALAFRDGRASVVPARMAFTGYRRGSLKPALHLFRAPDPRIAVEFHEGVQQSLAELAQRTALKTMTSETIELSPPSLSEHFAFVFRGFVKVPEDGIYTFAATSDDGSRIYVDDELVVDNDGLHGPLRRSGAIGLAQGFHGLRVEYFNAGGGSALAVTWRGPRFAEQPLPSSALFH